MALPSVAWLLAGLLLILLIHQNSELDLIGFACSTDSIQQFYDSAAFLFGMGEASLLAACDLESTRRMLESCGVASGAKVLELGFGAGRAAKLLVETIGVKSYNGIELSEGMLNLSVRVLGDNLRRKELQLHHSNRPLELLRFLSFGHFSHILALFVLDTLEREELVQTLELFNQLMEPSGRVCIAVLSDAPAHTSVQLYKTAWRTTPALFGGRRPLRLRELLRGDLWAVSHSWFNTQGWLPFEFFVLEKSSPEKAAVDDKVAEVNSLRSTALGRWAAFIKVSKGASHVLPRVRKLAAESADQLPFDVAKELAEAWLPQLPNATLLELITSDINWTSKEEIILDAAELLSATPSALLVQQVHALIRSLDRASLEEWISPNPENMTLRELKRHVAGTVKSALEMASDDIDVSNELLQHKERVSKMKSRVELLELQAMLERDIVVPVAELSQEELVDTATKMSDRMTRQELEDELLIDYELKSAKELRNLLRADLSELSREDLQLRTQDAIANSRPQHLSAAIREIALHLLTERELEVLAAAAAEKRENVLHDAAQPDSSTSPSGFISNLLRRPFAASFRQRRSAPDAADYASYPYYGDYGGYGEYGDKDTRLREYGDIGEENFEYEVGDDEDLASMEEFEDQDLDDYLGESDYLFTRRVRAPKALDHDEL